MIRGVLLEVKVKLMKKSDKGKEVIFQGKGIDSLKKIDDYLK